MRGSVWPQRLSPTLLALALVVPLLGACVAKAPAPTASAQFGACPAGVKAATSTDRLVAAAPPGRLVAAAPPGGHRARVQVSPSTIPDLSLECFVGGAPVELARLGRPAVLNLWASWCLPCRAELPQLQRLADSAGERLIVLGVVTADSPPAAASLSVDFGLRFPAVLDPQERLRVALGRTGLPITVFVGADGQLRHVYQGPALSSAKLLELTDHYLGVHIGAVSS